MVFVSKEDRGVPALALVTERRGETMERGVNISFMETKIQLMLWDCWLRFINGFSTKPVKF